MLALTNADIDTITRGRIDKGTILIRDGKIAAVGASVRIPKNADVVDVDGKRITPGLIDAHSHAGLAEDGYYSDSDVNETTDPITPHLLAVDGFKPSDRSMWEAAQSGVTTMCIMPGSANVFCGIGAIVKTWGETYADYIVKPMAGMKMATGENPKRVYGDKGVTPKTRMGIGAMFRSTFTDASNYIKKKAAYAKRKRKHADPFEVDIKLEAVSRVLKKEFPARCHAHRAIDMLTFMRIADEFQFNYVFEHATEAVGIFDELKKRNVPLVIGPSFGIRSKVELHHQTFQSVARAVQAGLTVAITSDHYVTPLQYLAVYAALAVREGLSEQDAMKAITINPAKIIGMDNRIGSIEKGKDADLVVWNGDPLDARNRPERVYIAGKRVNVPTVPITTGERNAPPPGT